MTHAVRLNRLGGPEMLALEEIDLGHPGPGKVLIRQRACGLNFIDTYFRSGLYPLPVPLPCTLGNEGAGEIIEIGPGVTGFQPGDRVTALEILDGYASERIVSAAKMIRLPDFVSDE